MEDPDEQYIELKCDTSGNIIGWSYELWAGEVWNSSQFGAVMTYCDNFPMMISVLEGTSNNSLENDTNNALFSSNASNFTITSKNGNVIKYDNGYVSGDDGTDFIPIIGANAYSDADANDSGALFYMDSNNTISVENTCTDNVITTFVFADNGVTLKSDGSSDFDLSSSDEQIEASIQ